MLRFRGELIPFGMVEHSTQIIDIEIVNTGHGDEFLGEYKFRLRKPDANVDVKSEIKNFDRLSKDAIELLVEFLVKALPEYLAQRGPRN